MHSLKDVVEALRREIGSALETGEALPNGVQLEAERVAATLQFSIEGNPPSFNIMEGESKKSSAHSITIEFNIKSNDAVTKPEIKSATKPVVVVQAQTVENKLEGPEEKRVIEQLTKVFGTPGFDSAARATVFREALETLSDAEAGTLVNALQGKDAADKHATVKRAMALLQRVSHSGPAGVEKGKAVLAEIFAVHSVRSIVSLVASVWKSQEDWMK